MKLQRQRHEQHHKYATFDKAPTICCQEKPPKQIAKQSLAAEASAMQHLYMSVVCTYTLYVRIYIWIFSGNAVNVRLLGPD